MSRIDQRLTKLETAMLPVPFKPMLTFLWGSPDQDVELAALERQAKAEDRPLIVIKLVPPTQQENTHVTA